jgi:hypothetical protein
VAKFSPLIQMASTVPEPARPAWRSASTLFTASAVSATGTTFSVTPNSSASRGER